MDNSGFWNQHHSRQRENKFLLKICFLWRRKKAIGGNPNVFIVCSSSTQHFNKTPLLLCALQLCNIATILLFSGAGNEFIEVYHTSFNFPGISLAQTETMVRVKLKLSALALQQTTAVPKWIIHKKNQFSQSCYFQLELSWYPEIQQTILPLELFTQTTFKLQHHAVIMSMKISFVKS